MIAEIILNAFSRPTESRGQSSSAEAPLATLLREFPDLPEFLRNKSVLDFGCGHGHQTHALVRFGAKTAVGYDVHQPSLETARRLYPHDEFISRLEGRTFDTVISQDAMEHFPNPVAALMQMRAALKPGGKILITFGPPWYAPYGAHMHFWCPIPWVNLLFPERAVMAVRARYRSDGAKRYEDVESGLNRMTIRRFERLMSDFHIGRLKYTCIKQINFLAYIPVIRELAINHATAVISPA